MNSFYRQMRVLVCLCAIGLSATVVVQAADKKAPPPPPPRSAAELKSDIDDLESLLNSVEKNIGTSEEKQRRSLYAQLLAQAEKIGVGLAVQRDLLKQAMASQPKNDPNGGLTKTAGEGQTRWQADLNNLDGRLKELKALIAALNPDLKAGAGPGPRGGAAGAGGGTTVTPSGGAKKK